MIIGLIGPAGAGKSSVATYLEKKYGAKRFSLAGPLKEVAERTLGFTDEQLYGTQEQKEAIDPRYGFSCRWFLQKLGTEGCRGVFGKTFWTDQCLEMIRKTSARIAVIEDVRFINEGFAVHNAGGYVWRLTPPADDETAARYQAAGTHASETEWRDAPADLEIAPRSRGLEQLHALADEAMQVLCEFPIRRSLPL